MVVIEDRRSSRGITRIDDPEIDGFFPWLPGRIAGELASGSRALRTTSTSGDGLARLRRAEMAEPLAGPLRNDSEYPTGHRPTPCFARSTIGSSWGNQDLGPDES